MITRDTLNRLLLNTCSNSKIAFQRLRKLNFIDWYLRTTADIFCSCFFYHFWKSTFFSQVKQRFIIAVGISQAAPGQVSMNLAGTF